MFTECREGLSINATEGEKHKSISERLGYQKPKFPQEKKSLKSIAPDLYFPLPAIHTAVI